VTVRQKRGDSFRPQVIAPKLQSLLGLQD
jgi:hypothetical protein